MKKYNITFFKKQVTSTVSIEIRVLAKTLLEAQDKASKEFDIIYGKSMLIGLGDLDINLLKNYIVDIDVIKNEKSSDSSKNEYLL